MSDNQTIARLKKKGKTFEILVDCETALKAKSGESEVSDALLVHKVFKDAHKGDVQGDLEEFFGTSDVLTIAQEIINQGEIQLTEDYRHKIIDDKRKQIIELVAGKAADPKTHYPIPRQRIELGMEKVGFKVSFNKSVKEQAKELMDSLREAMPITFKDIILTITSPPRFSGQTYGVVKKAGEVISQDYLADGSLLIKVKVPVGRKNELNDKLKGFSHGEIKIKEE